MTKVELVVARYGEPVDWVYETAIISHVDTVVIYDKSPEDEVVESEHPKVSVHRLDNVGREAHTFLHHIVHTYHDTAADVKTIFTQARYRDHVDEEVFQNMLLGREPRPTRRGLDIPWHSTAMQTHGWTVERNHANDHHHPMRPAGMSLGKFYVDCIAEDLVAPETVEWWQNAIFSTTSERIRSTPLESFVRLRDMLGTHSNPELAHYMERCWYSLLHFSIRQ